jgi:hypothetical protein
MIPRRLVLALALVAASCSSGGASHPPGDGATSGPTCGAPAGGFTACVHTCGETTATEASGATCVDGALQCPPGTQPAATCPNPWPNDGCGPWINGVDCTTAAVCVDGRWWECPGPDASAD